ncbi:hypothetical protein HP548_12485 [Paenibacillus taichungensis]|uniref:Uncharacterized protein n=1 Tax=Paenibacillus taichungensis TaxID=484184 RepID=A0ABX2MLF4_9BACL|nr:hypothetical protein [Paenibacillus taichungensis]NUU54894.1 hypothetical protein [Paenibacillus taichungensis]
MNVQLDFVSDWKEICIKQMEDEGLHFTTKTQKDRLIIQYLNYRRKKGGDPHPRNVHFSKEFFCPSAVQNGLEQLVNAIETGKNISPYFSTRVENIIIWTVCIMIGRFFISILEINLIQKIQNS